MKLAIPAGTTSKRIAIFLQDSSSTTGAGLTGLTNASAGLTCYSWIDTDGNAGGTVQALQSATRGTWTTRGFIEKDATNMPGWYEFGVPDALLASGVKWATLHFKGATNLAPLPLEIEVTAVSNQDAVRGGMTALPNVASGSAGAIPTTGTGANQLNVTGGRADADVLRWNATAVAAPATAGIPEVNVKNVNNVSAASVTTVNANQGTTQPVNFTGTGASALAKSDVIDWASGAVPAVNVTGVPLVDLKYTLGTISPATAGSVRADAVTGAVGSVTGAVGSVTGAVGSVTGAVGSVTGNVGGNVVGSVASVTAAVAITSNIKKNQALTKFQFAMTDSTNHNPATGKTVTCTRSIDGGAQAAGTLANVTEISNGTYTVDFGAGDLNGNVIVLRATATGCDDTFERVVSQP